MNGAAHPSRAWAAVAENRGGPAKPTAAGTTTQALRHVRGRRPCR